MLRKGLGQAIVEEQGAVGLGGPGSLCAQEAGVVAVNRPPTWRPQLECHAPQACCQELYNTVIDRVREASCSLFKCSGIGHEARPC